MVFDAIILWKFHHSVTSPGMANQWLSQSMKATEESKKNHLQEQFLYLIVPPIIKMFARTVGSKKNTQKAGLTK